ncbi:hypothetical protein phiAS5_ORF0154 [Aeromonas phage phiAS5]|uniref:Uncharacterized protein n=1 Tax=Aeromonas phage phiAS5 TaxID=879630 RepID=E1A2Q1_9CAUD|nr:hypothetical protein phiAS5_ORF0154 [Aeromonas phage phiAS5]ADM79997.1 hypothetical protein phiAS5_ORF0154 [Aeromonas phage phiAS5]
MTKTDDTVIHGFEISKAYATGSLVIYGLSENVWVCIKAVSPGSIFNAGQEWVRINDTTTTLMNKSGRQTNSYVKPVNAPKEYYDTELKLMMLHRNDNSYAQFDGIKETITFPTSPTNAQTFTTTVSKNVYEYDATNLYWKN